MLAPIPSDFEPTRATLHAYAHAAGSIPRAHAEPHEKWWHVSLKVKPEGWFTDPMALPEGGTLTLRFDFDDHVLAAETEAGRVSSVPLDAGLTGTQFGDQLIAAVAELGLSAEYARDKYESDDTRTYDTGVASTFAQTQAAVARVFEEHISSIDGDVGQLNLWPHGFDMAVEWFGTRVETYEEHGEVQHYPSQLNLGFYPGGRAYFYSNPWPFDADKLIGSPLPHGAQWHTEGWEGSILYYDQLAGEPNAETKLLEFARAVFDVAAPTLTA